MEELTTMWLSQFPDKPEGQSIVEPKPVCLLQPLEPSNHFQPLLTIIINYY